MAAKLAANIVHTDNTTVVFTILQSICILDAWARGYISKQLEDLGSLELSEIQNGRQDGGGHCLYKKCKA